MKRKRHPLKGRIGSIERDILHELSGGDLLYGLLLSARSTRRMYRLAHERAAYRYRRKRAIEHLIDQQFVSERSGRLSVTERGKNVLGMLTETTREMLSKKTWDGKWRIVTFDIPEKYAELRRKVRTILKKAGFIRLQQSLWVFPHECKELADLVIEESRLSSYIVYGVVERIYDNGRLKKAFKL